MSLKLFASRFKLIRKLSSSGQSEIWTARDIDSEDARLLVIKILTGNNDEILREFFIRETEALSQLKHNGIVQIFEWDFDEDEEKYWLTLEYLDGTTLEEKIASSNNLQEIGIDIMLEIIEAISVAHSHGIIHRDLKPTNIFYENTGDIKILDFGICKIKTLLNEGTTVSGFGTPPYTAPEQINGQGVDYSTDVYSLGVILFQILTGTIPIKGIVQEQVKSCAVDLGIKNLILTMISDEMENRPSSVLHVKRELMKYRKEDYKKKSINHVKVTQTFANSLRELGLVDFNTENDAVDWLDKELNSTTIHIEKSNDGWFIYTLKHRLKAVFNENSKSLIIKNIYATTSVDMTTNREWSYPCEVTWKALNKNSIVPKNSSTLTILEEAETYKQKLERRRKKELDNKKTILQWENILRLQKKILLEKDFSLPYTGWDISEDSSSIEVELLREEDEKTIFLDQPLLMDSINVKRKISIGTFSGLDGKKLTIALARGVNVSDLKEFGEVTLDNRQVTAALRRQEDALRAVRYGDSVNPRLLEIIENPNSNLVSSNPIDVADFTHEDLDEAKKEAVKATLQSDIYLIQGPPGTGKTKVISEIISQLLLNDPSTRILLTSQSNAAVDNALEATSRIVNNTSFLRVGRKEKIGARLTDYQLDKTLNMWIKNTKEKSDKYSGKLHTANSKDLAVMARYNSKLRESQDYCKDLVDLEAELSKMRFRLFEEKNQDNPVEEKLKTLNKKVSELDQDKEQLYEALDENIKEISKFLKIVDNNQVIRNTEEVKGIILILEKSLEKKRKQLSQLDQIEVIRQEWITRLGKGKEFEAICASETQVVASTCLGVSNIPGIWAAEYDWVIVDEAGRATPPEILVPLVRGKRILLVGDHKQLPPVVDIKLSKEDQERFEVSEKTLEVSLFEDIFNRADEEIRAILDIQYRMHEGIGSLVSNVFYEQTVKNASITSNLQHHLNYYNGKSVVWISTSMNENRFEKKTGTSKKNELEAQLITKQCELIEEELRRTNRNLSMGIISGYSEQKLLLEQLVSPRDKLRWDRLSIEIDNIDAFQGQEREVVVYSVVRSNKDKDIGFLRDYRRLNVALSRARKLLIIVGDHEMAGDAVTFEESNPFAEVLKHIQKTDRKYCALEVLPS
nr:serine/threonine-protein kinase [Paenibacillus xylanexedens]